MFLLQKGADTSKRDVDGQLAIDLAPDASVSSISNILLPQRPADRTSEQVRKYILQEAEKEGIDL